jgi:hypothetical protein
MQGAVPLFLRRLCCACLPQRGRGLLKRRTLSLVNASAAAKPVVIDGFFKRAGLFSGWQAGLRFGVY